MKLILASKSPRRKEILEKTGFKVVIEPSNFAEKKTEKFNNIEEIENIIKYNSEGKAKEVFERINNGEWKIEFNEQYEGFHRVLFFGGITTKKKIWEVII